MSLRPQQYHCKCYCNNIASECCDNKTNCVKRHPSLSGRMAVRKPNEKQTKTSQTNFVKVKRWRHIHSVGNGRSESHNGSVKGGGSSNTSGSLAFNNRRGCGHSQPNPTNFSRRNSAATTVTFSSPCASSAETYNSRPGISKKVVSSSSKRVALSPECSIRHEFTEQRRYYETAKHLMALVAAQQSTFGGEYVGDSIGDNAGYDGDEARLRALQQFRLENANDCFNAHRQQDLHLQLQQTTSSWTEKLQQAQEAVQMSKQQGKEINRYVTVTESATKSTQKPLGKDERLTPYLVRQKLLQLRLEAEEIGRLKPGRKLYGSLEKSCALRFQETY